MLSGYDNRNALGAKIQLVSGALGVRSVSGASANHAVFTLEVPEPMAIAGAGIALLIVGVLHRVSRRGSR